jgi:hypothetical protein
MGFDLASIMKGGVEGVLGSVANIIGKFKANPDIAAKASADIAVAEAALQQAQLDYEAKLALAQIEVNKIEAASPNWFVSGWRPSLGWICALGFTYSTIGYPFLFWISVNYGWKPPPQMDLTVVVQLTFGMLGLGTWRTMDKKFGTAK